MNLLRLRRLPNFVVNIKARFAGKAGGMYRTTGLIHLMWYVQQGQYPKLRLKKKDKEKLSLN